MEVRYNQESEAMVLKNGLKEGKDGKDSQGSLSKTFLKEQQEPFTPSGTVESCDKNRSSTGDPDYCRRILVRGEFSFFLFFSQLIVHSGTSSFILYVHS